MNAAQITEIALLLIGAYFKLMEQAGMSEEEAEAYFQEQYRKLLEKDPSVLKDV